MSVDDQQPSVALRRAFLFECGGLPYALAGAATAFFLAERTGEATVANLAGTIAGALAIIPGNLGVKSGYLGSMTQHFRQSSDHARLRQRLVEHAGYGFAVTIALCFLACARAGASPPPVLEMQYPVAGGVLGLLIALCVNLIPMITGEQSVYENFRTDAAWRARVTAAGAGGADARCDVWLVHAGEQATSVAYQLRRMLDLSAAETNRFVSYCPGLVAADATLQAAREKKALLTALGATVRIQSAVTAFIGGIDVGAPP